MGPDSRSEGKVSLYSACHTIYCNGSNTDFDIQQITLSFSTTSYTALGNTNSLNIKEFMQLKKGKNDNETRNSWKFYKDERR